MKTRGGGLELFLLWETEELEVFPDGPLIFVKSMPDYFTERGADGKAKSMEL